MLDEKAGICAGRRGGVAEFFSRKISVTESLRAHMRYLFRFLRAKRFTYEPLVTVEISREKILKNLELFLESVSPWGVAPVLKANAYGHGLVEVARIVDAHAHVPFVVVDSYYEALQLRNERITTPILVIGHTLSHNIKKNTMHGISFAVGSLHQLKEIAETNVPVSVHLKFDTGMHRQGITPKELSHAVEITAAHPQLRVEGICSHLADGDDDAMTAMQIKLWNDVASKWRKAFSQTKYFHLSATAGVRLAGKIDANVGRLGIGLYGVSDVIPGLTPALSMKTSVTGLRTIQVGERVGYGFTWKAARETRVATIPVGYYEGVDRRLSNKGCVRVRGKECPIIGRVSMNMTTVDVTDVPGLKEGDEVEVISTKSEARNSITYMAELCDTIPYDMLVHIPTTLRRVVI